MSVTQLGERERLRPRRWQDRLFLRIARAFGYRIAPAHLRHRDSDRIRAILLAGSEEDASDFVRCLYETVQREHVRELLSVLADSPRQGDQDVQQAQASVLNVMTTRIGE